MVLLFGIGMLGTGIILGAGAAFVFLYFLQMREDAAQFAKDSEELHRHAQLKATLSANAERIGNKENGSGR